jgi:tight adherence protein B
MLPAFLAALATGAAIYFISVWIGATRLHRSMTSIERANAQIEEDKARTSKKKPLERVSRWLRDHGYEGDWTPVILVVLVIYLAISVALRIFGLNTWVGAALALPGAVMVTMAGLATARRRLRTKFQVQLMQAFGLIATQIEAGDGAKRAIEKTINLVEDPLASELRTAVDAQLASGSLVSALKEISERYPSRSMRLFITALEIDEQMGAKLGPALRQAQTALEKDFELSAEANAEIAQAKGEFFAITAIIGFIVVSLVGGAEGISRDVYYSFPGWLFLIFAAANYAWGILRTLKIFRIAKGS